MRRPSRWPRCASRRAGSNAGPSAQPSLSARLRWTRPGRQDRAARPPRLCLGRRPLGGRDAEQARQQVGLSFQIGRQVEPGRVVEDGQPGRGPRRPTTAPRERAPRGSGARVAPCAGRWHRAPATGPCGQGRCQPGNRRAGTGPRSPPCRHGLLQRRPLVAVAPGHGNGRCGPARSSCTPCHARQGAPVGRAGQLQHQRAHAALALDQAARVGRVGLRCRIEAVRAAHLRGRTDAAIRIADGSWRVQTRLQDAGDVVKRQARSTRVDPVGPRHNPG